MKIAVAMSGGVDSSAAAAILLDQGHTVAGVTFRLFGCEIARAADGRSCCSQEDVADAMRVSLALGIDHQVVDYSERFAADVIEPFTASYAAGQTPNPCILCNQHIKFSAFLDWALEAGFDAIATGHHARVDHDGRHWQLRAGADTNKDQTYFLFPLHQENLPHVLFPVGSFTKAEVRRIAAARSLPVAEKSESQDVCFAAGGSYAEFLEEHAGLKPLPGPIVMVDGTVVGHHAGLHRYTVGQRQGLGVAWRSPLYVVARDSAGNRLVVGERQALDCHRLEAVGAVWTGGVIPATGSTLAARIRYRSSATPATVLTSSSAGFSLQFAAPIQGIATGQAAVLYDGDRVIGGGWIATVDGA